MLCRGRGHGLYISTIQHRPSRSVNIVVYAIRLVFCVTIDQQASDYLPYLFGQGHYRVIRRAAELPELLPRLYLLLTGGAGR